MAEYAKAFISHSSSDVKLLEEVVSQVAAARWEIDSLTFEEGRTSADQIFKSMVRSDLFILFASQNSLASPWVESELEIAQQRYYKREISGLLVFVIDDITNIELPPWLRPHVFARTRNSVRISNLIRAKLMQLDSLRGVNQRPFVSRNILRGDIERRLSDLSNPVKAIYVSGNDGIGRRSLISNSLQSLFPNSDTTGVNIPLQDGEGVLELYRKLYIEWNKPTQFELNDFLVNTYSLDEDGLIRKIIDIVNEIGKSKGFVWVQCDHAAVIEDGTIEPQFKKLFQSLDTKRPNLIIRSRRLPTFYEQSETKNIAYFKVESLSDEESKRLWFFSLDYFNVPEIDETIVHYLNEQISGHPNLIWMAAEYVAQTKIAAIKTNPREFSDNLHKLSLSLIDGLPLSLSAKRMLCLFDEFGTISAEDLLSVIGVDDQELGNAVSTLTSYSLLEADDNYFRLAPFFQHARFRKRFSVEVDIFLKTARNKLLDVVRDYYDNESISFSTIDDSIIAAIKEGRPIPLALDERAIVGSYFLRIARSYFDRKEYLLAIKFCNLAFEKSHTLTESASIEVLRLLGMSAVREGDFENLDKAKSQLGKFASKQAKRHVHFIGGFEQRWDGSLDIAEDEFKAALSLSQNDIHALRELSQIVLAREDYAQAERLSRQAMLYSKNNPFLIDILLQCLIEQRKGNINSLMEDSEINELFSRLEVADKREQRTFFSIRRAQYLAAILNYSAALEFANVAVREGSQNFSAYVIRAEIKLATKTDSRIQHSAENDIKELENIVNNKKSGKGGVPLIAKLRIRFELLAKRNLTGAVSQFNKYSYKLGRLKPILSLEIAHAIIDTQDKDPELIRWANVVLSK